MLIGLSGVLVLLIALHAANGDRRDEVIKFMERENFLERCRLENRTVDDCISDVKYYCRMQHVGSPEITDELMACVRRVRCGLPLLPTVNQSKTFLEERPSFKKKKLTYILLNKATNTILTQAETLKMVEMSIEVWKCYTPLQFERVTTIKEADLILSFTPQYHGYYDYFTKKFISKGWKFDGRGGVLAHAFLPYTGASNTGNFHYDDDEIWIENHRDGTKIFHTTVHELGHNLGLPHTSVRGNIMYGMYDDSFHETELDLGHYDRTEIQIRYGSRQCTNKVWQEYYKQKYPDGDPTCEDKSNSCDTYTFKRCLTDREWMSKNCASYCGFCGDCEDVYNECSRYDEKTCQKQKGWILRNCKKHCKFCAATTDIETVEKDEKEREAIEKERKEREQRKREEEEERQRNLCMDAFETCVQYPKEMCSTPPHAEWMGKNCRKYCGYCRDSYGSFYNTNQDEVCAASRIDAIVKVPQMYGLMLFINGFVYKWDEMLNTTSPYFKMRVADFTKNRVTRPTAAVHLPSTDSLFLFQGRNVFQFLNAGQKGLGNMKVHTLPGSMQNPTAAFYVRYNKEMVIFVYHERTITMLREVNGGIRFGFSQPFANLFKKTRYPQRIPRSVDSAFQDKNRVYFLTGSSVTIAYQEGNHFTLPVNGMKPFMTDYLHCPQVY